MSMPSIVCGECGCEIIGLGERAPKGTTRRMLERMHAIACRRVRNYPAPRRRDAWTWRNDLVELRKELAEPCTKRHVYTVGDD